MSGFCDKSGLKSLIKDATCYKNPKNPGSIDLILTNNSHSFQNFCVIKAGSSNFHRMVVTAFFWKVKTKSYKYRGYKSFENKSFREELKCELSDATLEENARGFKGFVEICQKTLRHCAPIKQTFVRSNHFAFMNKTLSKTIIHRTKFRNNILEIKLTKTK